MWNTPKPHTQKKEDLEQSIKKGGQTKQVARKVDRQYCLYIQKLFFFSCSK